MSDPSNTQFTILAIGDEQLRGDPADTAVPAGFLQNDPHHFAVADRPGSPATFFSQSQAYASGWGAEHLFLQIFDERKSDEPNVFVPGMRYGSLRVYRELQAIESWLEGGPSWQRVLDSIEVLQNSPAAVIDQGPPEVAVDCVLIWIGLMEASDFFGVPDVDQMTFTFRKIVHQVRQSPWGYGAPVFLVTPFNKQVDALGPGSFPSHGKVRAAISACCAAEQWCYQIEPSGPLSPGNWISGAGKLAMAQLMAERMKFHRRYARLLDAGMAIVPGTNGRENANRVTLDPRSMGFLRAADAAGATAIVDRMIEAGVPRLRNENPDRGGIGRSDGYGVQVPWSFVFTDRMTDDINDPNIDTVKLVPIDRDAVEKGFSGGSRTVHLDGSDETEQLDEPVVLMPAVQDAGVGWWESNGIEVIQNSRNWRPRRFGPPVFFNDDQTTRPSGNVSGLFSGKAAHVYAASNPSGPTRQGASLPLGNKVTFAIRLYQTALSMNAVLSGKRFEFLPALARSFGFFLNGDQGVLTMNDGIGGALQTLSTVGAIPLSTTTTIVCGVDIENGQTFMRINGVDQGMPTGAVTAGPEPFQPDLLFGGSPLTFPSMTGRSPAFAIWNQYMSPVDAALVEAEFTARY